MSKIANKMSIFNCFMTEKFNVFPQKKQLRKSVQSYVAQNSDMFANKLFDVFLIPDCCSISNLL